MSTEQDELEVSMHPLVGDALNKRAKEDLWSIDWQTTDDGQVEKLSFSKVIQPYEQDERGLLFIGVAFDVFLSRRRVFDCKLVIFQEMGDGDAVRCEDPYSISIVWDRALEFAVFICRELNISYHRIFERKTYDDILQKP